MHRNGPGLRVLGKTTWYGPGYCGICGTHDIVPRAVRFYDPDDGWKPGVLCEGCGEDACDRGPQADDYAVVTGKVELQAEKIDVLSDMGDEDAMYSECNED